MSPSLGGQYLFGVACHVSMIPNANAYQVASFFGVQGVQGMDGGQRGRVFEVSGLLVGETPAYVVAAANLIGTFADGVARTFIDTTGTAWSSVVYRSEFQWAGAQYLWSPTVLGWVRPYKLVLHGLV